MTSRVSLIANTMSQRGASPRPETVHNKASAVSCFSIILQFYLSESEFEQILCIVLLNA